MHNLATVVGGVVLSAVVLSGCGGGGTTVTATLKDLTLAVDNNSGKAGDFTFKADNKGALVHELVVFKTDVAFDKIPQKDGKADESTGTSAGEVDDVAPGKAESKTFKLAAGKYVLLCNVPAHYAAGMAVAFTVQ